LSVKDTNNFPGILGFSHAAISVVCILLLTGVWRAAIVDIDDLSNPDQLASTNPIRVKPGVAHARDTSLAEIRIPGQRL
jgi:hypothetical protein